jgi:uncharacterized protein YjbI with pentapeptide repeats
MPDTAIAAGDERIPTAADLSDLRAIETAFNDAAKRINTIWVSLILFMAFVFIATGKITHKDLFLETPVKLPGLGVDVPLRGYFVFVPAFILALHFYLTLQLSGVVEKIREYDRVLGEAKIDWHHATWLRQRLDNSLFAKVLGGAPGRLGVFLRVAALASTVIAPPWLIVFVQLIYLPEQDSLVTNWHRIALAVDIVLALLYVTPWILLRCNPFPGWMPHGSRFAWGVRFLKDSGWPDMITTFSAMLFALWISLFVAVFPWQRGSFMQLTSAWFMAGADPVSQGPAKWFSNRLVLSDQNLIDGLDLTKVTVTRAARNRHFVAALFDRSDLRQIDFTGSDLSYASFDDANLQKATLACAYTMTTESSEFKYGGCARLLEASFNNADLAGASLSGVDMRGASLRGAKLVGANLTNAQLQGAMLDGVSLNAADLDYAGLDGASIKYASLIGTNLYGARLRGANLSFSVLFGATLDSALAQNASFAGAQLQGASMTDAHLDSANFLASAIYGTDVSRASFSGARINNVLTAPRWSFTASYSQSIAYATRDLFEKDGDNAPGTYGLGYVYTLNDMNVPGYFARYNPIPASEADIALKAAGIDKNKQPADPNDSTLLQRLARLKPGVKTPDWAKLVSKSASEAEYENGLGDRLIFIACAKFGGLSVVRGLVRSQILCPFGDKIRGVLNTEQRPDGMACENLEGIVGAMEQWRTCPKPKAQQ